jgi:hypothetical protein
VKKIAQNVAQAIFVKIIAQHLPWKRVVQTFGQLLLQLEIAAQNMQTIAPKAKIRQIWSPCPGFKCPKIRSQFREGRHATAARSACGCGKK